MPETFDLTTAVYAKTAVGQQEIQTRSLGLSPLVRRILVLIDGKRTGSDLTGFLSGSGDIEEILAQLLAQGCVEAQARVKPVAVSPVAKVAAAVSGPDGGDIPGLPPADSRTAKDNDMARNFMINTVNSIFGQHTRISLVRDISEAQSTEQLRSTYHAWKAAMESHRAGNKRLPELHEKLFNVL